MYMLCAQRDELTTIEPVYFTRALLQPRQRRFMLNESGVGSERFRNLCARSGSLM